MAGPRVPQQVHLGLRSYDLDQLEARVLAAGGSKLDDREGYRIYADPVGHPLCAYPAPEPLRDDPVGHPFCLGIWRAPIPSVSSYARDA